MRNMPKILRGMVFPFMALVAWEFLAVNGLINVLFFPPPSIISKTLIQMLRDGILVKHLFTSLARLAYGFFVAVILAVPMGVLVGRVQVFRYWITPALSFLQQIPPIAWIPIFILWLGIEEASKIAVIVYASFFPLFLNTVQGVSSVDTKLIEVGRAFMLSPWEMIRRVIVPSALMSIFVGLRLGLSNCWRALVGAELIGASAGIGYLIIEGRQLFQPDKIFVAIFTIGLAGLLIDFGLKKLEKRLMPWKNMYQAGKQNE